MKRVEIINKIGIQYLTENVENGEFSYPKAYKQFGIPEHKNMEES